MDIIFIIGFMASGKTTFGKKLALEINYDFIDLDAEIEKEFKQSISEIFKYDGEDFFRKIEHSILKETISKIKHNTIISCGGGTPFFYDNLDIMKQAGKVVFLDTDFDIISERLTQQNFRPLYNINAGENEKTEAISKLYKTRLSKYSEADLTINEQNQSFAEIIRLLDYKRG